MRRGSPKGAAGLPIALLAVGAFAAAAGCRERGRPDPNIRMAISHDAEQPADGEATPPASQGRGRAGPGTAGGDSPAVPTRLEVPDEVKRAFKAIRLTWKDAATGKEGTVEVPLDGIAKVPDSGLEVAADVFLPAFSMSQQVITSTGTAEENPAARIRVSENGKEIFAGWIFTRFPDVHPFTHPRFSLRLDGGVRRASA